MTEEFKNYFEWLIPNEGSVFEDDPDDPGGATKFGIDQRSHPNVNIRTLQRFQAQEIYWNDYWLKVGADKLKPGVAEVVCDIGVNNGTARAARWLQEIVGTIQDGIIGPITIMQANKIAASDISSILLNRRESFYKEIARGRQAKYLKGWLNRNHDLREYVSKLI